MQRGESVIATTGLLLSVIILAGMGAAGWWTSASARRSADAERRARIEHQAGTLADLVGPLLEAGDLSALRRLTSGSALQLDLQQCRVMLPDGSVLAAERGEQITRSDLPDTWLDVAPVARATSAPGPDAMHVRRTVTVPGRGDVVIELRGAMTDGATFWADTQMGIGLIGAGCLLAVLLVYRHLRGRLRASAFIRDALLALEGGETDTAALTLREDLGPEAIAWNELIAERARFHDVLVTRRLLETSAARQDRGGNLTDMCDAMAQGLLLVDDNLNVTYGNGAAAFYLGTERHALLGARIEPMLPNDEVRTLVRGVATGDLQRATAREVPHGEGDERGVLRFSVRPVRHDDAGSAMVVIEDVTQQHVVAESRQSFIEHVTHELRTPLSNILLYVESAMDEGESDAEIKARALNVINQEARRLDRIVGDMLSVSEMEAGSYELQRDDVALAELFEELQNDYAAAARQKGIALEFDLPPKMPVLRADRDKISLAVHNLIGNAIKYTPEKGYVTVRVDVEERRLVIAVTDSGIGIAPDEQGRVFEKFYRAKDDRLAGITGSGLGLALARQVVRLHGGDIALESQIDQGSTFTLHLPLPKTALAA